MISPFIDDAIKDDRDIKNFEVGCKCSAEVLWFRLPIEWTEAEVNQQITDAQRWFKKYCIELTFKEFALDPTLPEHDKKKKEFESLLKNYENQAARIPKGKTQSGIEGQLKAIQTTVEDIFEHILEREKTKIEQQKKNAKGKKIPLVVLFLDEWYNLLPGEDPASKQGRRRDRISSNHVDLPLIGLDRYDRTSRLLLAHELAHGLRKGSGGNKECIEKFLDTNTGGKIKKVNFRRWDDHYSGANQDRAILFIRRAVAFQPYAYNQNHVFSVREYLTIFWAGYVSCVEGCDEKKETRTPFYITDIPVDLTEVAHLTPGLRNQPYSDVLFPSEFRAAVRKMELDIEPLYPPNWEESPSSFKVDRPAVEMPVQSASESWPEMPNSDKGVNPFSMSDLMLDLTAVPDMTPGLSEMALSNLSAIVFPVPAFWPRQPTLLPGVNAPDEETKRSPDEKIMEFGEFEEDATFVFVNEGLVDMAFNYLDANINSNLPQLVKITKEQVKGVVDTINPALTTNFTCTGNCGNIDSIKIEQQASKVYGPKSGGVPIPTLGTISLNLEADVITPPPKAINLCITEEELEYQRKNKEYERKLEESVRALLEYNKKKKEGNEPLGPAPKPPEGGPPQCPDREKRFKPGSQIQQDFIIRWDMTISGLGIEYTQNLYKQTVSRYSPCCPIMPGTIPIPPSAVPQDKGGKEDGKEEEQKEFFLAGLQDIGEAVSPYSPYSPVPPYTMPASTEREEGNRENQQKQSFIVGLEDIALSAEALATKFMATGITLIPIDASTENAATNLNIKEVPLTGPGSKTPSENK